MSERKLVLVVEDGLEYTTALSRLAKSADVSFVRTGCLHEAREELRRQRPSALLLDVVFDRTKEEDLAGDLSSLIARSGGDHRRAVRALAESQGFFVLDALAPELPPGLRVVIAHDFASEPRRLEALRQRVPGLVGLPDGASATEALALLLS